MADQVKNAAGSAGNSWDKMSEDQKKQTFDSLPQEKKQGKSYLEWVKEGYHNQYENWMPWIEDQYLKWFTNDNKASYATKDTLDKTKVTGIEPVDKAQDGVNNLVGGQLGKGGALQGVGDTFSKEGINRTERGGKDENGSYGGAVGNAASSVGSSVTGGLSSAGSYVGSFVGGGNKEGEAQKK
ncbi:hypothetical protein MBLNU13_g03246t1 [Cladosporium sp. NU13]